MSVRMIAGVCMGVLVLMMTVSPTPALTIHPAVLKNFVGPFKKPGDPILRPTFFNRPRMMEQRLVQRIGGQGSNALPGEQQPGAIYSRQMVESISPKAGRGQESVYPVVARGPALPEEWNRSLRSCKGSGSCGQNMDNTLNLLMRMMETGKR